MRKVVWSAASRRDLIDIVTFIAEDNPFAADRVVDTIEIVGNKLGLTMTGRRGRVTGSYEKVVLGLPYILAYELSRHADGSETVNILRVIHAARDWPPQEWPKS